MKRLSLAAALLIAMLSFLLWPRPQRQAPSVVSGSAAAAVNAIDGHELLRPGLLSRLSPETAAFRRWAGEYAAASAKDRADMPGDGKLLAAAHRIRLKSLVSADPRRALEEALPVVLRQDLPAEITALLEERVSARGFYGVLGRAPDEVSGKAIERVFEMPDGRRYEASVYGRRVRQRTTESAAVHGVAVDGIMAIHEDPLRPMDPGERPRADQTVFLNCPVSGRGTALPDMTITPESPAVEIAGEVHVLCSGGHIHALREQAVAAEGGTGGPSNPTGAVPATWSTGVKSVLYIRVTFPDTSTDPQQEKDAYDMMKQVNDFFVENSHGQLHLLTTVTPLLTMPWPEAWYKGNDSSGAYSVLADARGAARAAGFDYAAYDLDAVRYNGASGSFAGQAYIGGRGCWLKSGSVGVAVHEFGHNLGLWHANSWSTGGESTIGSGTNSEYGHSFDSMGSANAGNYFFNAGHQNDIRWLPDENVTRVTGSGIYRIFQHDQGRIDPASRYLLTIKKDAQRDYWCEFRQKFSTNRWAMSGVQMLWSPWGDSSSESTPYGSNAGGQLLDTAPGSPDGKDDGALTTGRTFSDHGAQLHITTLGKGGTVPESMDIVVNAGAFPGNQSPSLALDASTLTPAANETVTFTATATDPDGDPLAYAWDWGDRTFGANAAVAAKAWSTAGTYTVRCEVSDMRGGTRSAVLAVTVGSPSPEQFTLRGRVLTTAGDPIAGVRVHNGLTAAAYRGCHTDSEGNYIISGLVARTYTLGASILSHTCSAGFANPAEVVDQDITGADFVAAAKTTISISLPDDVCTEGGDGAVLRFTRTAPASAGAIDVRVFVGGPASMADIDCAPAETYDLTTYKYTIPDGQPSLDVAITAFNDATAEGPEQMTFHLIDGSGYIPSGVESVTLAIDDNDTSLPVVGVEAIDATATEGADGGTLRLSRSGPVDAPLTVSLTRAGTATAATDYSGINTVATIPAGESFIDLSLVTMQDTAAEGTETATFTLTSTAAWIRAPQRTTASVVILDDDIPVVTITAADNAAAETNSDPAVFILTRTGNFNAPLMVDYAMGGTASHGTDYRPLSGTVTIPAGLANASLVITPVDDAIGEQTQTISVQLRSAARYVAGIPFSASATLTDNDLPHVMATVSDGSCDEGGGTGKFKIQSYGSGTGNTTVHYSVSGTAAPGADFAAVTGTALVPKSGYFEVTITPLQDTEWEDAESIVLTLQHDAAYTLSPENAAVLFLTDDDQPLVSVAPAAASYQEDGGTARFYFSRNGATTDALTVTYALTGTATAGADYTMPAGTLTIPAEATGAFLDITLLDDAESEGTESLVCTVVSNPGIHGARVNPATLHLNDTETAGMPAVSFVSGGSTQPEDAGAAVIPVILSAAAAVEVRVEYALESGLAFNGVDYTASGGTLVFPPGQTTQNIPVLLLDDLFQEPSESIGLRLVRASAARTASPATHSLTITDNDLPSPPVVGFAGAASTAGEGSGTPPLALAFLGSPQPLPVSVAWSITGGTASAQDAGAMSGNLTFLPGETAKPVPVPLIDDSLLESSETLVITLSAPSLPATLAPLITHTLTISDNDDTTITIAATDGVASEEGPDAGQFTVTRASSNLSQPVTVLLTAGGSATSGEDFATLPAEVVIPAGETTAVLAVTPVDDAVLDPAESVVLVIAPSPFYATGNPATATVFVTDNETGISITATDDYAKEPGEPGSFTLTRIGPSAGELTVNLTAGGTATTEADFHALPVSVTFAGGQTTALVNVTPVDDTTAEPDETVSLTIEPGAGYLISNPSATVTIHDDDTNLPPEVTINSPAGGSAFIPAGPGVVLDATITDDGRPFPTNPLTVSWSVISGPGAVTFGDTAAADTTAQFSAPGSYLLRLSTTDAELAAQADLSVFILSDTFTGTNVGTTSSLTGLAGGGDTWTLTGVGSGVTASPADSCYFAHRLMAGDFTIVTRVASIAPVSASTSARCGVMVRSTLAAGAKHACMTATPNRSSFIWRIADGGSGATSNTNQLPSVPRYVRLQRTGNQFTAAHSMDGAAWTTQGSPQTITMSDPVYAGLVATSASATVSVIASFDAFSLTRSGNTGPFVDAGPHQTTGLSALLAGIVTDDAPPLIQWEKVNGPGGVSFPPAPSGAALFDAAGSFMLRLSADDGAVRTFDDTVVTVISPFSEWRALHFSGNASDPLIAGPRADPDNDGLENLAEYVLTSNPAAPDSHAAPAATRTETTLSMTWRESTTATDVIIEPQWSADMIGWDSSALAIETLTTGPGWTEKRAVLDISSRPRASLRLRVTLP